MFTDVLHILLWIAVIILLFGSIDDLIVDVMYWAFRSGYKNKITPVRDYENLEEKPIALMIGAWNESKVIGRTLNYILQNTKYDNYRVFVGVYPNDKDSISVLQEYIKKSNKIVLSINATDGPSTKADNLNNIYSNIKTYEKKYGKFSLISVFDAEDFIHPYVLKLQNYYINYKNYDTVQIPVTPIRSKISGFFHKTYCDMFAELHQKDMITKQEIDSYIPLAGTGMCFSRKIFTMLEKGMNSLDPISTYKMDNETFGIVHTKKKPRLIYTTVATVLIILIFLMYNNSQSVQNQTESNNIQTVLQDTTHYPYYDGQTLFIKNYNNTISIQVYSFNTQKLALNMFNKLNLKTEYMVSMNETDGTYRISLGHFSSIEEAKKNVIKIKECIND